MAKNKRSFLDLISFRNPKPKSPKIIKKRSGYEAASKATRLSDWYASPGSADSLGQYDLQTLRFRARDLRRNNPYAARGIQVITTNVVGKGIKTQIKGERNKNGKGPIEIMFQKWASSVECDFDGRNNFYSMQRIIMDAVAESGEILIRKRYDSSKEIPLQLQLLEADFLNTTLTAQPSKESGNFIIQGIEFNSQGKRVAYHVYESHPGNYDSRLPAVRKSNRIPADQIIHVYRMDRPGQARGVPWLAPVMIRLKDIDDYEDMELMRQKTAACFTAFVRDLSGDLFDPSEEDCEVAEKLEPGLIEELPPGKTIEFVQPPNLESYNEFVTTHLHAIAAGLGISFESMTGDLSQVNFSSARMGWLEMGRNVETWRKHLIEQQFLNPILDEFLNIMNLIGMQTTGITYIHTPPRREMIDPTKEVPAIIKAVRAGLIPLSQAILESGRDPEEVFEEIALDNNRIDALSLTLDTDPRKITSTGKSQDQNMQGDNNE